MLLVSFWFNFAVDCVLVNTYKKKLLYPHLLATMKASVAQTGNASLQEVSRHHDDASCFDASWLSINKSITDSRSTHSEELPFFQKALTVNLARIKDSKERGV